MGRSSRWNRNYALLEEYYKGHGNIDVPQSYKVNGVNLGTWLNAQRQAYQGKGTSKITKDRIEKLEKLGIKWDIHLDVWNKKYVLLEKYYKKHGNIDVPKNYKMNGVNLGTWLNNQRQAYRGKGNCRLTLDKIKKLEKLGIKWHTYLDMWEENYILLEKYYKKYGNIDISKSYKIKGVEIGAWLDEQRQAYQGRHKINPDRVRKLNKLDIDWFPRETVTLNKPIKDMEIYNRVLNKKMDYILRDIKLEGMNMITSMEEQKEIEKVILKRLFK